MKNHTTNQINDLLYELECHLLNPEVRHSRDELEKLLDEEFVEFTGSGRSLGREQIISALADESNLTITIKNFQTVPLAENVVLATYLAKFVQDDQPPSYSWRSSIWKETGDRWRMVFHQGTPAKNGV